MQNDPVVHLDQVTKTYRSGLRALDNTSLSVAPGEFVSIVGPSGCGKSTLLRLLAGLAPPTSGTIRWQQATTPPTNSIGFVFQEPTLLPWSNVWKNVYLPLRLRGISRREATPQVAAALQQVGLADFARAYPRQLSGGMKMRVSIARALVTRPRLLLLDEPFAALDEITRFRLNDDLLRLWHQHHWTVVFVTHSVYESVYLSQRILVMTDRPGSISQEIPIPDDTLRTPDFRLSDVHHRTCRLVSAALQQVTHPEGLAS